MYRGDGLYKHRVLVYPWQIDCIDRSNCKDTGLFAENLRIIADRCCERLTELELQQVKVEEVPGSSVVRVMTKMWGSEA